MQEKELKGVPRSRRSMAVWVIVSVLAALLGSIPIYVRTKHSLREGDFLFLKRDMFYGDFPNIGFALTFGGCLLVILLVTATLFAWRRIGRESPSDN